MHTRREFLAAALFALTSGGSAFAEEKPRVRVAVIGGVAASGAWEALGAAFEADTGWKTEMVASGPQTAVIEPFQRGEVDLIALHTGERATKLVAEGYGENPRPWACNEHAIIGPASDPAGIRSMKDGAAAFKKIATARAPLLDFHGPGSREIARKLWERAGVNPEGDWLLEDESDTSKDALLIAEKKQAYIVLGRIPVASGKVELGKLEILVQGDPEMRRSYVVIEASAKKFPQANSAGARALADWLSGEKGQRAILDFGRKSPDDRPLLHPVKPATEPQGTSR